jgi:dihydrofolate reductase
MKSTVYMAVSVDGFIARENGDLDWLPAFGANDEDYGYHAFMESIDALIMGRNTFEKVLSFGVDWPYGSKPVIVLSSQPYTLPDTLPDSVENMHGDMGDIVAGLLQRGFEHLYVDGGRTAQTFLNNDLIDRYILTVIPVLIGSGISLFGSTSEDRKLSLVDHRSWPSGLLQLTYDIDKSA